MLLRHTPDTIVERKALTIQPAKTCQPIGALYAALGVHKCLPHSHGSQGCCAYHRSALTRHYKDPIMAGTSSFTEGASVFGGQANILEAVNNIFSLYDPEIIAVHTTCLSEVIGDDLTQIIKKAVMDGKVPAGKLVVHTSTPSFKGSHVTGFANMTASFIQYMSQNTGKKLNQVNILPGFVEPSDMAEIKRITAEMGIKIVMLPDTSEVVNAPMDGKFHMYPKGGTKRDDIVSTGDSKFTVALGRVASLPAAKLLDTKCKVPFEILDMPLGIRGTDAMIDLLHKTTGVSVPESIMTERGQLVDAMTDMEQYTYKKKVALIGDPDLLVGLVSFLTELDMEISVVLTGTPSGPKFERRIKEIAGEKTIVKAGLNADMFLFHQLVKETKPDLLMGNSYVKYMSRDLDIPLIRVGFPIYDRIGHQYFPTVGYRGALHLYEKILSALMDRIDRDTLEEKFDLIM